MSSCVAIGGYVSEDSKPVPQDKFWSFLSQDILQSRCHGQASAWYCDISEVIAIACNPGHAPDWSLLVSAVGVATPPFTKNGLGPLAPLVLLSVANYCTLSKLSLSSSQFLNLAGSASRMCCSSITTLLHPGAKHSPPERTNQPWVSHFPQAH